MKNYQLERIGSFSLLCGSLSIKNVTINLKITNMQ